MPSKLWGVTESAELALPAHTSGFLLLLFYSLLLAYFIYANRREFSRISRRHWLQTVGLSILAFLFSQLFPLHLWRDPDIVLTPLALFPLLLAGAILGPVVAVIVGLFAGLGQALGQSHQLADLFHYAFIAGIAATMLQQNFLAMPYQLLRHPFVGGIVSGVLLAVLRIASTFVGATGDGGYVIALDQALAATTVHWWPATIEGALAGVVVALVLTRLPDLRPERMLVLSPWQRSLRKRLLSHYVLFAVFLTLALVLIVFGLSVNVSTQLVVNQMAHNAQTVSAEIPDFQAHLQDRLAQFGDVENLLNDDAVENTRALKQLHRVDSFYRRLLLINRDQKLVAFYPADDSGQVTLSDMEKETVARSFVTNTPKMATAVSKREDHILSFVVPVLDARDQTAAVLVGRVPQLSLVSLIVGLQGTVGEGVGFIVDDHDRVIAHSDESRLLEEWSLPEDNMEVVNANRGVPGVAYRGRRDQSQTRELVYYMSTPDHPWRVVTTVPYTVVLNLALSIGGPLTLVLLAGMGFFYFNLAMVGRDITRPVSELVEAAKMITAGGKWVPPTDVHRTDEIGELSQAFGQMYRSRNRRLKELSLLLDVSHNVATNVDVNQGLPAILRGALRGTGAAGARAVVFNPSGPYPLTFGQGPAAEAMSSLDRAIISQLRHSGELLLATPTQVRTTLGIRDEVLPVMALIAVTLRFHGRFRGVLWLGYRQSHGFDPSARTLLQTLAGQAAVLVENARLFAVAEGGRRRLAAVLDSTIDAFIVTDQRDRVLWINPAMESAFGLKMNEVRNRPVTSVLKIDELVAALAGGSEQVRDLEITNKSGKIFYCSVSPLNNNNGQAIGRVAVLHDITHLKQIDQMKSDFVAAVSHDLLSPLTFMRGYANMLSMVGDISEKQEDYINKILKGIDQVKMLADDLLDLGRIEAGIELAKDEIDIKIMLASVVAEHRQFAKQNGLNLRVDVKPDVPLIKGDLNFIRRAVANLVMNGIKYAPHSGDMLLKAESQDDEVVINVKDNGPGVPKHEQVRLFEKFYQVNPDANDKIQGAGLGLAIVKSVAERHGGRAWCESQTGQGSTFFISLPVRPPGGEEASNQNVPE